MSVAATKWVWEQNLAPSEKLVLLCIADYAWKDGSHAFPGLATIADSTGLSERQVQRYISGFIAHGILAVDEHQEGGRGLRPVYRFTALKDDAGDALSGEKRTTPVTPFAGERVTSGAGKGDTHDAKRVTPKAGKGDMGDAPYKEEPKEPPLEPSGEPLMTPQIQPFDLLESLCETVGAEISVLSKNEKGKQLAAAKRLVASGVTPADVRTITAWLLGQSWVTSGVDMFLIEKQLGKWQLAGKPASPRASPATPLNGYSRRNDTMSPADLAAYARELEAKGL